ncbi:MAG: serine protease [Pirellulaceae bacterium]
MPQTTVRRCSTALCQVSAFALVAVCWAGESNAQVKLDRFYPPVVVAGSESFVTAEGKVPEWPCKVICDRDELEFGAEKDSGKFKVTLPADVSPGVAWVRLHDAKSASGLTPVLISRYPVTMEVEPNDKPTEAAELKLPAVVVGKLHKNGDVDVYQVSLQAGQTLVASVTAHQILRSPMDGVLQLTDLDGNVILQSEDVRGIDPQIVYQAESNQHVLLRIFAFPEVPTGTVGFAGADSFVYAIDVTTGLFVDHVLLNEQGEPRLFGTNLPAKNDLIEKLATSVSPTTVSAKDALGWAWLPASAPIDIARIRAGQTAKSLPVAAMGHISQRGQTDEFRFQAKKGTKYRIESWSKKFGFLLDSELTLIDVKTQKQLANNDDQTRGQYDSVLEYSAKDDAELMVQLRDLVEGFGPRHAYQLMISESTPGAELTVDADHFAIEKGKPLEISVAINRDRGFDAKVRISVSGLPTGIEAESVISEPKGATAKSVKLKLSSKTDQAFQGNFSILGVVLDKDDKPTNQKVDARFNLRPEIAVKKFWLSK